MTGIPAREKIEIVYTRGQLFFLGLLAREEMRVFLRDKQLHVQVRRQLKNRHEDVSSLIAAAFDSLGARDSRVFHVQTGDRPLTRLSYTRFAPRFRQFEHACVQRYRRARVHLRELARGTDRRF